jgi:hypothetical protein
MSTEKPTVLIVEDNGAWQFRLEEVFEPFANILIADNPRSAEATFFGNSDIKAVVVDGYLLKESRGSDVVRFLVQQKFAGPIVAMSTDPTVNDIMMTLGATHKIDSDNKLQAAAIVERELSK